MIIASKSTPLEKNCLNFIELKTAHLTRLSLYHSKHRTRRAYHQKNVLGQDFVPHRRSYIELHRIFFL
jgi:hypothetical protein